MPRSRSVRLAHEDGDLAARVPGARSPPLPAVDDILFAVPNNARLDVRQAPTLFVIRQEQVPQTRSTRLRLKLFNYPCWQPSFALNLVIESSLIWIDVLVHESHKTTLGIFRFL